MKIIGISLVNSLLILLVVLIHKIFFRVLLLDMKTWLSIGAPLF